MGAKQILALLATNGELRRNFAGSHPKFTQYTVLTKTPRQILATENVNFPVPAKQQATVNYATYKYCDYHREKGHDTDGCWTLKQEIEKAVKLGCLAHLVKMIKEGGGMGLGKTANIV